MGTKREKHTLSCNPGDWQRWTDSARERGLSVAEYLRRAEALANGGTVYVLMKQSENDFDFDQTLPEEVIGAAWTLEGAKALMPVAPARWDDEGDGGCSCYVTHPEHRFFYIRALRLTLPEETP